MTDSLTTDRKTAHYQEILDQAVEVKRLESIYIDAKETAKEAKSDFDAADLHLRAICNRGPDPQGELPFGEAPKRIRIVNSPDELDPAVAVGTEHDVAEHLNGDWLAIDVGGGKCPIRYEIAKEDYEVIG